MATAKLTFTADERLIEEAKRLARARNTSVSAMFSKFLESLSEIRRQEPQNLGPITKRASGIVKMPDGKTDEQLLEDALAQKYGVNK